MSADRAITERDGGRCVRNGEPGMLFVHHRLPRSGGDNENPSNKITLCAGCHSWVHAHPKLARIAGWIVSRYADPAAVPVKHHGQGGYVLLDDDYGFRPWLPPKETGQ